MIILPVDHHGSHKVDPIVIILGKRTNVFQSIRTCHIMIWRKIRKKNSSFDYPKTFVPKNRNLSIEGGTDGEFSMIRGYMCNRWLMEHSSFCVLISGVHVDWLDGVVINSENVWVKLIYRLWTARSGGLFSQDLP
jgi:hypothetical protein